MGKLVGNMIKGAVVFAAVGALIGLTLPYIAPGLAAVGILTKGSVIYSAIVGGSWYPPLIEAVCFGMFGALVPPLQGIWSGIFGDADARAAADHQRENVILKTKIRELEGREQTLEDAITPRSRSVQRMVAAGPRNQQSFSEAASIQPNAPGSLSIH